ncbi:DUF1636 family protein [Paracoccus sp. S3-43]|uniref:DUF1636 family protein n=1 Tax=Paracoccus sp. S3-43 TaxID=3030011 RepID=UPI0023B15DFB|nr:DUF1636 family protein [Paracoccus sp. S3-43]WEF24760.1 DUF1636 family protein [Paracoccus sp. S3-43]
MTRVFVCAECPGGADRLAAVRAALDGAACTVRASGCLSGCRSGGSVAVRAPGRMAYLFGPVDGGDRGGLRRFLDLYHAAPGGEIRDARPLGSLRFKVLARIPGA